MAPDARAPSGCLTSGGRGRHTGRVTRLQAGWGPVALITGSGLAVRAAAALLRRPWHDEYFTAWLATSPWSELVPTLAQDSGPPLPYVLAKLLASAGMAPLTAARLVAVVAGCLAILVAARAARTVAGPRAAAWAAALLAFHPLAVAWSAEGRAYSLLLLGVALVWDGLAQVVVHQRGTWQVVAGAVLALFSHGLGLVLLIVMTLVGLSFPGPARRRTALAAALAALSFLPWVPVLLTQPPASLAWMVRAWQSLSPWRQLVAPLALLPPGAPFGSALDLPSAPLPVVAVTAVITLALAAAALAKAQREVIGTAALILLPAAALASLAHLGVPAFYPGRGEALYLAPAMGLLAAAAARGRPHALGAALLVGVGVLTCGVALRSWQTTPPRPEEQLAHIVATHLPDGGTVLVEGYWRLGLWYHLGEAGELFQLETFPPAANAHPGWYEGGGTPADAELARQRLAAEVQRGRPVACLLPPRGAPSALRPAARAAGLAPATATSAAEVWISRGAAP